MGKTPVRMKAVVYALSPFQQKVMPGLWKDLPGKIHHKVSENWISATLLLAPLVGTYTSPNSCCLCAAQPLPSTSASAASNLCECSHHQPPSQANLAAISPQRRSPYPAPSPAPSFPSPAHPPQPPSSCTQPSSASQLLLLLHPAAQIPTSASAATINLHLRPTSQPSVHKGAAQILHPAQPLPSQPSSAAQLLHPAQLSLATPAAAAPSSYPALAAQPSPPAKALQTQLFSKGPAHSTRKGVTVMADSLKEVAPALTVPVPSPVPVSLFRILNRLNTRWEELAQYEPLSDFPSDGAVESKRLDRRHTYQFLMGLKSDFETLRTQILNTSPLPSLYEAFAIVDGDERRRRLLPSLSESPIIVPDQRAFAASSGTHLYCQHCRKPGHLIDRCFMLHPELKQQFPRPRGGGRGGGRSGGRGRGTPRTGAIAEVESIPTDLPDFKQLQLQIAQLQSHLGLAPTFPSSGPTAAIVVETPTALHGSDFEIFAADNPIPPRSLPILEPSPPTPNDSLPPIDSQNPSPCAHAPLPASSLESGMSSPLVSDPPLLDIPLVFL
ncbi:Cytochrome b-c1 complex, subunit 8 protein [Actinidia rufa]|uniref:Cytochrome b-c1 complex, subunit 8 protein n=2 Tax=Actinidia rufa TaxID=165716 RepID=A0A7J0FUD0_9ERIC|nr:Cytochrome b-c1 complex, subunit 8 protein [Actinidia rufa]